MTGNEERKRTIWVADSHPQTVSIIDQRFLPHELRVARLRTVEEVCRAIKEMWVRGAPLIGATAAYGMYLACLEAENSAFPLNLLNVYAAQLKKTRPTAVNLAWAVDRQLAAIEKAASPPERVDIAFRTAGEIVEEDVAICRKIGDHGLKLIEEIFLQKQGETVQVLTHCNAGRMACIEWGTATAPIYLAHQKGIPVHVYVDETRPRNQGARITAWELEQAGVPHTVIADNSGGLLMQRRQIDLCMVGTDRTTRNGDVANKIGTYLKALAAADNGIPFYVALPSTTIDWQLPSGADIPIEERSPKEVTHIRGLNTESGRVEEVLLTPQNSPAYNPAFDITPARLVTALITEKGVCEANEKALADLFGMHHNA